MYPAIRMQYVSIGAILGMPAIAPVHDEPTRKCGITGLPYSCMSQADGLSV